jgi:gliding motility-associated-like protein
LSTDTNICPLDTAQLNINGTNLVSVHWTPPYDISNVNIPNPRVWPITTTFFTVVATENHGCHDTESIKVAIQPAALINLPDSVRLFPGQTYQLSPQGNCMYYTWWPTLGLSPNANFANPIANPAVSTRYFVTGVTEFGCIAHDSIDIFVNPESNVDVPNAFTPGTGANGSLHVNIAGLGTLERFTIYNRWGNKLFETTDIAQGWDGTYKGEPQPLGVYVYILEGYTSTGKRIYKQGNVTLVR